MKIDEFYFPEGIYFDTHHQWTRIENHVASFGLTDYAQSNAGDIVFVELPRVGTVVRQGEPFGSIESGKWVGRLYAPIGGEVEEVNDGLARDPRAINRDPYRAGWIARIRPSSLDELSPLMRSEAARAFVESEIQSEALVLPEEGQAESTAGGVDGKS